MQAPDRFPPDLENIDTIFDFRSQRQAGNYDLNFHLQQDHTFRHARELETATHGGYLQGSLVLPPSSSPNEQLIVQFSTIPSAKSEQQIHPNMLHVTIMNPTTRRAQWKLPIERHHWRLRLRIRANEAYLLKETYGSDRQADQEWDNTVNPMKIIHTLPNGHRELRFGDGGLLATIITPKQGSHQSNGGVIIKDVFRDRLVNDTSLAEDLRLKPAEDLVLPYTSKKVNHYARIELHRCRIQADVIDATNDKSSIIASAISNDIKNSRNNDVGAINLLEMSDPRCACTKGGFKVLLSSEFRAPTLKGKDNPIQVVFVIARNGQVVQADKLYPEFRQINPKNGFQIYQNSTLAFVVPEQSANCIKKIRANEDVLQLALYRPHDQMYSEKMFRFDYFVHPAEQCCFCTIKELMGGKDPTLERKKRAKKDNPVRRTLKDRDNEKSDQEFSPKSTISSLGYISSEEFSPPSKAPRISTEVIVPEEELPDVIGDIPISVIAENPGFTFAPQQSIEPSNEPSNATFSAMLDRAMEAAGIVQQEPIEDLGPLLNFSELPIDVDITEILEEVQGNNIGQPDSPQKPIFVIEKLDLINKAPQAAEEVSSGKAALDLVIDGAIETKGKPVMENKSTDTEGLCDGVANISIQERASTKELAEKSSASCGISGFLANLFGKLKILK